MAIQGEKTLTSKLQIDRLVVFLKEVRGELSKVTWPGPTEVKGATIVVIIVCIFVAVVIWIIDKIINLGLSLIF